MGEFSSAHNGLVDDLNQLDELELVKVKLGDLEDRNCRNNRKFIGIPESVTSFDLSLYLQQLLKNYFYLPINMTLLLTEPTSSPNRNLFCSRNPETFLPEFLFFMLKKNSWHRLGN